MDGWLLLEELWSYISIGLKVAFLQDLELTKIYRIVCVYLLKVADLTEEEDKFNENVSNNVGRCCDGITKSAFVVRNN